MFGDFICWKGDCRADVESEGSKPLIECDSRRSVFMGPLGMSARGSIDMRLGMPPLTLEEFLRLPHVGPSAVALEVWNAADGSAGPS